PPRHFDAEIGAQIRVDQGGPFLERLLQVYHGGQRFVLNLDHGPGIPRAPPPGGRPPPPPRSRHISPPGRPGPPPLCRPAPPPPPGSPAYFATGGARGHRLLLCMPSRTPAR